MHDEIREDLNTAYDDWPSDQAFVDAYAVDHEERFGEPWIVN